MSNLETLNILKNIPTVERESPVCKSVKMVFITVIIIILIVGFIHNQKKGCYGVFTPPEIININTEQCDKYKDVIIPTSNKSVSGKYIYLTNLNKQVPIQKIVVLDSEGNAIEMSSGFVSQNKSGGMSIEYELLKDTNITQIIIDVDMTNPSGINIVTTQVKIKNSDKVPVWSYNTQLKYTRYNYVYIVRKRINKVYPRAQSLIHPVLNDRDNELLLTQNNILNNWS